MVHPLRAAPYPLPSGAFSSVFSYLRTVARLAVRELRGHTAPVPRQRLVVERGGLRAEPRRLQSYLAVTGGSGIRRFGGDGAVLPPFFPAVWEAALALELLAHRDAPSLRGGVVHLESEMLQVRALRATDTVRCRMELDAAELAPSGVRLCLLTRTWNAIGQLCTETRTVLLVRQHRQHRRSGDGKRAEVAPAGEWKEVERWRLRANHGRRYARASGDFNPIHLWRVTAMPFGYRRPVLQGFCTAAMVAHGLIEAVCGGEPAALRRIRVVLRSPLLLPATVLLLTAGEGGRIRFRVAGERGRVYAEGDLTSADIVGTHG